MGLSAPKNRSKISHDPQNTTWAHNTSRFGHRILTSHGWTPGSSLGAKNASHSDHYTAASKSHIRVLLKDDNLGLGAKLGSGKADNFGLAGLESILGRLNGKEEEVKKEEERREKIEKRLYIGRRWGSMNFISGGFLVGDGEITRELPTKEEEAEVKIKIEEVEDKPKKKRKRSKDGEDADERPAEEPKLKRKKKSMNLRAEAATQTGAESESDAHLSKSTKKDKKKRKKSKEPESPSASTSESEQDLSDHAKRKAEKRALKEAKRARKAEKKLKKALKKAASSSDSTNLAPITEESASSTTTNTPATSNPTTGTSTPLFGSDARHAVRARYIRQKKMATMDPQALREIFMIKTPV